LDAQKLCISLEICLGAEAIGAVLTMQSMDTWYAMLHKPFFLPPNWILPWVWTVVYLFMGVALYTVWQKPRQTGRFTMAYIVFGIQLALNVGWYAAFFGYRSVLGGLMVIVGLWVAIVATIHEFSPISGIAAHLLIPYLVGVSYVLLLNYAFWWLNR
jgi:benzodiazapine receptor